MGFVDLDKAFKDIDETGELKFVITVSNENISVKRNIETNVVDIIPAANWNGKATINFTCYDTEGQWATQVIDVTVTPVNDLPTFNTIGGIPWRPGVTISFADDSAATEEHWFNFTVTGNDIDVQLGEDDELTFKVSDPAKVLVTHTDLEPLNATLSFYPTDDDVGVFSFTIAVKDKYSKNYLYETTVEITVKNTNDKPTIISIKKYSGGSIYEFPPNKILDLRDEIELKQDQILTLIVTASDPDLEHNDDILTFNLDAIDFIEVDSNTGDDSTAKIIIRPGWDDIGLLVFNITVKDLRLALDSVQIKLYVDNVNDRPTAEILSPGIPDMVFNQDDKITFEGEGEDNDIRYGDELSYLWKSDKDGELGTDSTIIVSNLSIGRHLITFTVTDKAGESHSNVTTIIIREPEEIPTNGDTKDGDDGLDMVFIGSLVAMIIIIIVMLLILFIVLRKHRKGEKIFLKEEDKLANELKRLGEDKATPGKPGELQLQPTGEAGVIKSPTQYVPPPQGIPQTLPEQPASQQQGQQPTLQPQQPQIPLGPPGPPGAIPFLPPQMTTCPKCNSMMTFGPDGKLFCMICGYTAEK